MINSEIIISVVGTISTIAAGWAGHFFTKKKYNAEVDSLVIENLKHALEVYIKLSDDTGVRLEKIAASNQALLKEVLELREKVVDLTEELRKYKKYEVVQSEGVGQESDSDKQED